MTYTKMPLVVEIAPDMLEIIDDILANISREELEKLQEELKEQIEERERAYIWDNDEDDSWKIVIDL